VPLRATVPVPPVVSVLLLPTWTTDGVCVTPLTFMLPLVLLGTFTSRLLPPTALKVAVPPLRFDGGLVAAGGGVALRAVDVQRGAAGDVDYALGPHRQRGDIGGTLVRLKVACYSGQPR